VADETFQKPPKISMNSFPKMFLQNILVIGKANVEFLKSVTGSITLIAQKSDLCPAIMDQILAGELGWFNKSVQSSDLEGKSIVFDFTHSKHVCEHARELGVVYHAPSLPISTAPTYILINVVFLLEI
jgi:hypothetical protein